MSWNCSPRIRFTPELWDKWLARRELEKQQREKLGEGIEEFRARLEKIHGPRVKLFP